MKQEASSEQLAQIRDYLASAKPSELEAIAQSLGKDGKREIKGIPLSDFQAGYICAQCATLHMKQLNEYPKVVPIVRLFNPPQQS